MPYQNISASLTETEINDLKAQVAAIRVKLPFLQTLTKDERIKFYKMGPQRLAWVQECLAAARNNPDALPKTFKVEEFARDFELAKVLADLRMVFKQLFEDADDTTMGAGNEAARAASDVMGYIDQAADTVPGLKTVAEKLHSFFERANAAAKTAATDKK